MHSRRTLKIHLSATALAFGVWGGVRSTVMPAAPKTASKASVNLLSRSRRRKRNLWAAFVQVHQQVPALLRHPRAGRVPGRAQDVDTATGDLHHEEHVDPLEEDGVDGEEITCENTCRLSAQERGPGGVSPAWRGIDAGLAEDPPDGSGSDTVAQPEQLTVDPSVAP